MLKNTAKHNIVVLNENYQEENNFWRSCTCNAMWVLHRFVFQKHLKLCKIYRQIDLPLWEWIKKCRPEDPETLRQGFVLNLGTSWMGGHTGMCHVHYVPSAMCHDLDDLHDLNVLHDLNDLNDFHDLHKWTLTNENSPFYHVKKVHIKNCI